MQADKLLICAVLLTGCAAAPKGVPHLVGVANFREVGGYNTENGHSVRRGLLYRSAQLSTMTPADRETLHRLGIRYDIDLRSAVERTSQPTDWAANPPSILIPFHYPGEDPKQTNTSTLDVRKASYFVMSADVTPAQVNAFVKDATVKIATERADEIGAVIRALAYEDSPALLHCSGGKDRTGVSVAVLMKLLGVRREEIYQEYLRSNGQLETWYRDAKEKARAAGQPYNVSFELFRARSGVDRTWLESAFQAIDREYQSFDQYTQDGLRLSPQDLQRLRARFLVS